MLALLREDAERCHAHYEEMLDENGCGLAREVARINLTLATYTQWYWKIDLHNLLHFLALRADAHAQYEIRAYVEAMLETVRRWVPLAHAAFVENRLGAVTLSAPALAVVRRMIADEPVAQPASGLSAREWRELMRALGREEYRAAIPGGSRRGRSLPWSHSAAAIRPGPPGL